MLRYLLLKAGNCAFRNGLIYSDAAPRGLGLAACPVIDNGDTWTQGAPVTMFHQVVPRLNVTAYHNQQLIPFRWERKEKLMRSAKDIGTAPKAKCVVQTWAPGARRVSMRFLIDPPPHVTNDLRIIVPQGYTVYVENQDERYPCKVDRQIAGTVITLCDGTTPSTNDKLEECGWMLGGKIDLTLPPGSAEQYLADIPSAQQQYGVRIPVWRSIDFIVVIDGYPPEAFGAPIILEREAFRPLFKPHLETKVDLERRLLVMHQGFLNERRGWAQFGNFPEAPGIKKRVNYNDHYFTLTALTRAVVKTAHFSAQWDRLARAMYAYDRDMCWSKGQHSHGKGLVPWSGPWSGNGHNVDIEKHVMHWVLYGDEFAKQTLDEWQAAVYDPTQPDRETSVFVRQCDVMYAFTGNDIWKDWSKRAHRRVQDKINKGELGVAPWFHPEAMRKVVRGRKRIDGMLNVRAYPTVRAFEQPFILYPSLQYVRSGPGMLGEGGALLQLHAMTEHDEVYGANIGDPRDPNRYSTRVFFEVLDDQPVKLFFRLGRRIQGDSHQTSVRVYDPTGQLVHENLDVRTGQYVGEDSTGNKYEEYNIAMHNAEGLWKVDVSSYALLLYKQISEWQEWQEGTSWRFPSY